MVFLELYNRIRGYALMNVGLMNKQDGNYDKAFDYCIFFTSVEVMKISAQNTPRA